MPVNIHGKEYRTVAERIQDFHADKDHGSIITDVIKSEGNTVIVKATIAIADKSFTGHGMEVIGSTNINKTSALENAETSAVGRALAFAGWGGTEIASADEVATAISQQNAPSYGGTDAPPASAPAVDKPFSGSIDDENKRREIREWIKVFSGDDVEQSKNILRQLTEFTGREGEQKFVTHTRDLKGKWLISTHKKAKAMHEANQPPEDANQDDGMFPPEGE